MSQLGIFVARTVFELSFFCLINHIIISYHNWIFDSGQSKFTRARLKDQVVLQGEKSALLSSKLEVTVNAYPLKL